MKSAWIRIWNLDLVTYFKVKTLSDCTRLFNHCDESFLIHFLFIILLLPSLFKL